MKSKKSPKQKTPIAMKLFNWFAIYYILGLVLGFIGLQFRCNDPLYSCWTLNQYISDPWLWSNTLIWPFPFLGNVIALF